MNFKKQLQQAAEQALRDLRSQAELVPVFDEEGNPVYDGSGRQKMEARGLSENNWVKVQTQILALHPEAQSRDRQLVAQFVLGEGALSFAQKAWTEIGAAAKQIEGEVVRDDKPGE